MKRTLTTSIATVLLGGLPLVSSGAIAQQQNYPGAMCVGATPTTLAQTQNNTTATVRVTCPIVRDMGSFAAGNAAGNVWVTDGHLTLNVCCASKSRNPSSGSTLTTANKCSTGVATGVNLSFSGPVVPTTFDYRYYSCTLPAVFTSTQPPTTSPSRIEGYRSSEL